MRACRAGLSIFFGDAFQDQHVNLISATMRLNRPFSSFGTSNRPA